VLPCQNANPGSEAGLVGGGGSEWTKQAIYEGEWEDDKQNGIGQAQRLFLTDTSIIIL
jgi:hypothetical protein